MKRSSNAQDGMPQPRLGGIEAAYIAPKRPSILKALLRRLLGTVLVLVLAALALTAAADAYVRWLAKDRVHELISALPAGRPALVLGTSPYLAPGQPSPYFAGRMEAAALLYKEGKAGFLIVSGDNRELAYNEPMAMRKALRALGVPDDKIVSDFAGLRTLDSVVRVKEVFGQSQVVVVSQRFHAERAVCLARHFEIDAVGYCAPGDQRGFIGLRSWLRERMARVRMILDLYVFDTAPRHLGPKEAVPQPAKP